MYLSFEKDIGRRLPTIDTEIFFYDAPHFCILLYKSIVRFVALAYTFAFLVVTFRTTKSFYFLITYYQSRHSFFFLSFFRSFLPSFLSFFSPFSLFLFLRNFSPTTTKSSPCLHLENDARRLVCYDVSIQ